MKMTWLAALALSGNVFATSASDVLEHYADIAHAVYGDSLTAARDMQQKIDTLLAQPTQANLDAARSAWVAARHPYQQSEVYRFGNAIVDDWEGKVNAWPLDEGLIDYTAASYGDESDENPAYTANIVANALLTVDGRQVDAREITPALLADMLHELDGVEANVATGYHAIEFLLWGQDLNGTGPGAGQRPASDFDVQHCTGGHCDRRAAYLKAATELLVADLAWMTNQWSKDGTARQAVIQGRPNQGLATILTGMGSLSYGEMAGDRMKLGLMLHDPEEEHDCFSDNTHWSHYDDALGMRNVYIGEYRRIDGSLLRGPAISELVAATDADTDKVLRERLNTTLAKMQVLVDSAAHGEAYDQLIAADNPDGNAKVRDAIDALVEQTKAIEQAVVALGLDGIAFAGANTATNAGAAPRDIGD